MGNCIKCGRQLSADEKFCVACGTKVVQAQPAAEPVAKEILGLCDGCGSVLFVGDAFCDKCGPQYF